jgi:phenylalanyl-tRNA synthetase beta chain
MKLSLEWLRDYIDLGPDLDVERIAHALTMTTVEVEGAVDVAAPLAKVVVGQVRSVAPVTPEGKLRLATCDLGQREIPVVCGARNVKPGMRVAVALPGATVRSPGSATPQTIQVAEIAGARSEGMLCSAAELGLEDLFPPPDAHSIVDLSPLPDPVGTPLAAAIGWEDTILEIDNKSLTNRPDLWGHFGMARELAAIFRRPLEPPPTLDRKLPPAALVGPVDDSVCARFTALRISGAQMQEAPLWMRSRLARIGQRSRNLFVDLTNYVMFAVGQPSHVYDADRLILPLGVRRSSAGERLRLLDDREVELEAGLPVIADGERPVAAAGVMGGALSAVTRETREVVLEVGTFDPVSVRRTATRLGVRSEASARFEKALDTPRVEQALGLFAKLLEQIQPAAQLVGFADVHPVPTTRKTIDIGTAFLQERLGEPLPPSIMKGHLTSLGFAVEDAGEPWRVIVPTWRSTGDVSLRQDLVEEVARLHGYANFKFVPPQVRLLKRTTNRRALLTRRIREVLAFTGGMQEVVSYPWVKDRLLDATGLLGKAPMRLGTPPSPEESHLRPSLVPNLLEAVTTNLRYSTSFRIFEIGRVFLEGRYAPIDCPEELLPKQPYHLAAAFVGSDPQAMIVQAKGIVQALRRMAHLASLDFSAEPAEIGWADPGARLALVAGDRPVGCLAVLSSRTRRVADIKRADVVMLEICLDEIEPLATRENAYRPLSAYPEILSDLSFLIPDEIAWASIVRALDGLDPIVQEISFVDQFRGEKIPAGQKSVTLRLRLGSPSRTLKSDEVAEVMKLATRVLGETFQARLRT